MYDKELHNSIENLARETLGFKKIGETWVSETILFNIVKGLYPYSKVIKHHRPKWLQGLELDIFLPQGHMTSDFPKRLKKVLSLEKEDQGERYQLDNIIEVN